LNIRSSAYIKLCSKDRARKSSLSWRLKTDFLIYWASIKKNAARRRKTVIRWRQRLFAATRISESGFRTHASVAKCSSATSLTQKSEFGWAHCVVKATVHKTPCQVYVLVLGLASPGSGQRCLEYNPTS